MCYFIVVVVDLLVTLFPDLKHQEKNQISMEDVGMEEGAHLKFTLGFNASAALSQNIFDIGNL